MLHLFIDVLYCMNIFSYICMLLLPVPLSLTAAASVLRARVVCHVRPLPPYSLLFSLCSVLCYLI